MGEKRCGEMIVQEVLTKDPNELSTKNPMVLSCGGVYIPRRGQQIINREHHILTMPNAAEPIKIVAGLKPHNVLHEVMQKESLN